MAGNQYSPAPLGAPQGAMPQAMMGGPQQQQQQQGLQQNMYYQQGPSMQQQQQQQAYGQQVYQAGGMPMHADGQVWCYTTPWGISSAISHVCVYGT